MPHPSFVHRLLAVPPEILTRARACLPGDATLEEVVSYAESFLGPDPEVEGKVCFEPSLSRKQCRIIKLRLLGEAITHPEDIAELQRLQELFISVVR